MAEVAKKSLKNNTILFPDSGEPKQFIVTEAELHRIISEALATKRSLQKKEKTNSRYKVNGVLKAAPADPIRSREDFQKFVKYLGCNGPLETRLRNETIFVLGCSVGLRCGDLMNLKTADVYTSTGEVKNHLEIIEEKTKKRNICKIPHMAVDVLQDYYEQQQPTIDESTFLFPGKNGALSLKRVYTILNNAGKACGFEGKISTHTMRKTYAMAALQSAEKDGTAGQTLEMLKMKFNHSDERITMHYVKADQDKIDKMSDRVSDWFEEN